MTTGEIYGADGNPSTTRKFDVIVVDPPWSYGNTAKIETTKYSTAARHYDTVGNGGTGEINRKTGAGIQNIIDCVPVADWAADNAHLYLWTTNPKLPFAFEVMRAWGFDYKTTLTWVKVRKDGEPMEGGMGFFFRGATEHALFGVKGRKSIDPAAREPNMIFAQRGAHSEKPQAFYDMVERVSGPGARLDVFARKIRPNWHAYGDQVK